MTVKLYDENSYATEFEADVTGCEKTESGYRIELDRTLFFPEEGGQCCDRGTLNNIAVTRVEICGDTIYHYCPEELTPGERVAGKIDFNLRFRNMQNHSGEHIICGIAHKLFGCENVGFHLGEDCVTMDLDCELKDEDIQNIEALANEAVAKNLPVTAVYPSEDELKTMTYRAKGEIDGKVRIVTIGDVDSCACCAPHVAHAGEIGIIKIIDFMRHRGGMRFTLKCGFDALSDYSKRLAQNVAISNLLSVKQDETAEGVKKLLEDINALKMKLSDKNKQMADLIASSVEASDKNICIFCNDFLPDQLRYLANNLKDKTPGCVVAFSGTDAEGYKYVVISEKNDVSDFVKKANASLLGRGGGRGNMASGSFGATREQIENYFDKEIEA